MLTRTLWLLACVAVGGCTGTALHGAYCITSPAVNTSAMQSASVSYWRWLNADYDPFMHHWVDVWDGAAWQNLWITGGSPATAENAHSSARHTARTVRWSGRTAGLRPQKPWRKRRLFALGPARVR